MGGDEQDLHLLQRPEMQAVLGETDLPTRLRLAVQGAAGTNSAVATLLAEIDAARLGSMSVHARHAHATGQLAVPEDECRDVLFATTDGSLWRTLVDGQGWTDDRYAAWLGGLWVNLLATPG